MERNVLSKWAFDNLLAWKIYIIIIISSLYICYVQFHEVNICVTFSFITVNKKAISLDHYGRALLSWNILRNKRTDVRKVCVQTVILYVTVVVWRQPQIGSSVFKGSVLMNARSSEGHRVLLKSLCSECSSHQTYYYSLWLSVHINHSCPINQLYVNQTWKNMTFLLCRPL